jgi:hypothetical protein
MTNPVRVSLQGLRARINALRFWMDDTKVLGHAVSWYVSGWRLGLVFIALAVFFPQLSGDQSQILTGAEIGVYVILALGLNIVVGPGVCRIFRLWCVHLRIAFQRDLIWR